MSMSIGSFLYNGCLVTDIIHEKGGQCSFYCRFPLKSRFLKDLDTKKQVVFDTTSNNEEETKMLDRNVMLCNCKQVSYADVEDALHQMDKFSDVVQSFDEVQKITHCSTGCGGCHDKIMEAISEIMMA